MPISGIENDLLFSNALALGEHQKLRSFAFKFPIAKFLLLFSLSPSSLLFMPATQATLITATWKSANFCFIYFCYKCRVIQFYQQNIASIALVEGQNMPKLLLSMQEFVFLVIFL